MWHSRLKGVGTIFILGNPFEFRLPDPIEGIKLKMLDLGLKNTDLRLALQSKSGGDLFHLLGNGFAFGLQGWFIWGGRVLVYRRVR